MGFCAPGWRRWRPPPAALNRRECLWEHAGTGHGRTRKCARRRGTVRSASQYFPQSTRVLCGKYSSTPRQVQLRCPQHAFPLSPPFGPLAMPRRPNAKPTHPFLPECRQSRKPSLPRRSLRPHEAWEGRENNFTTTKKCAEPEKAACHSFLRFSALHSTRSRPATEAGTQASPTRPVRARPCSRAAQNDVCRGARPFSGCGPKP